jgi:adenosine kinase
MKPFSSVVVTGTMAYDEIMDFPGKFIDHFHPERLHQINISFAVSNLEKQLGGTATNISYNLSLANAYLENRVSVIPLSAVGKDGRQLLDFFKKNGVKINGIYIDKTQYTATGKVITDQNDNQIWGYYYGASKSAAKIDIKKHSNNRSLWIISANHPDAFLHFQKEAIRNNNTYR